MFANNSIDDKTNFSGTPISAARIEPELRTKLEKNIRHIHWDKWYEKPKFYPFFANITNSLWNLCCRTQNSFRNTSQDNSKVRYDSKDYPSLENSTLYLTLRKVLSWRNYPSDRMMTISEQDVEEIEDEKINWETKRCWVDRISNAFVRFFWWISDYGSSTKRVITVFFGWNIIWAFVYQFILPLQTQPILVNASTTFMDTTNIGITFMQTNLLMFSVTDIVSIGLDYPALLCVSIHSIVGYFILAALITRLGIMFQNLSP
jgi:hypothetical protein